MKNCLCPTFLDINITIEIDSEGKEINTTLQFVSQFPKKGLVVEMFGLYNVDLNGKIAIVDSDEVNERGLWTVKVEKKDLYFSIGYV